MSRLRSFRIWAAVSGAALLCACRTDAPATDGIRTAETGSLIAFYAGDTGSAPLLAALEGCGAELLYEYRNLNGIAARLPSPRSFVEAAACLEQADGVLSVMPDQIMQLHGTSAQGAAE
ncbi:protease inhibitor I9 family protein [Bergeriella denitrificans]|uniref:Inhibitor I9 domain-containing protein n=1 Tax=Bergeriella denitrificans TaxID=494 RepID=A0A378UJ12_BERDE|nr:protease inhibitor I9 family protein [Bergeriella denitrificans]STZ76481.1 Uncharacterised protein [Bergeriella denitrificans]